MTSPLPVHHWCCYRCSGGKPERENDTPPQAGVLTAVILLVHVRGQISLQDESLEGLADETADGNLALLRVSSNWRIEIRGAERDHTELPVVFDPELMAQGQIDVDEVRVAAVEGKGCRAWRQSRIPQRDMVELYAPDDVRSQVPLVAGIAQREALIDRGRTPGSFATVVEIGAE